MRKLLNYALAFSLILPLMVVGVAANGQSSARANTQTNTQPKPAQAPTTVKPATPPTTVNLAMAATASYDELIAMLPASDLVAVIDVNRAFIELLPKLAGVSTGGVDKMSKQITEFTQKTGIDPSKIQTAVLGVSLQGTQANGAILIQGVDADAKQIEAGMKEFKAEYKTSDYKGRTIFNLTSKMKAPEAGPVSVKTDETALVSLGNQRLAFGDLTTIKNIIDVQTGAAKPGVSPTLANALKETRASGLIRFAMSIPQEFAAEASNQGDLFKSLSAIKVVLGSFDVAGDLSLTLDTVMRTGAQAEASELESGLKGLVSLAKGFLGSGGDPKMDAFSQLIDGVKIGMRANDVMLSITAPRAAMDQLFKKSETTEKKQ